MQELIELLELNDKNEPMPYLIDSIKQVYMSKEKEQLIKAHIDGFDHIVVDFKKQEYAEQYYNETFNQTKANERVATI